jgi:pimeloyl-ACP methyl ester carboxylesterase
MRVDTVLSHDQIPLKYACERTACEKPWLALILPFGMKVALARAFFDFFRPRYNLVTWESRLIFEPTSRQVSVEDLSVDNHVRDLTAVLRACEVPHCIVVGYCSGAGVALAASNAVPQLVRGLVLAHGEYALLDDHSCTTPFALEIDSLLSMAATSEDYARSVVEKIGSERLGRVATIPDGMDTPYTDPSYLHRHALNYLAYKATDFRALARSASHGALLLSGGLDVHANVQSSRRIFELMPNAQLHIDSDGDHYGMVRDDSTVMITIWNYLHGRHELS